MKALLLKEYGKFSVETLPEPKIAPDEVLIHVKACAICGSDIHGYDGTSGRRRPPLIIGHEAAGLIERVGANVTGFKKGDRVVFNSSLYCGNCVFCKSGRQNLCVDSRVYGVDNGSYHLDGAMAEYIAVPARILYRLPENLSFEQGAMVEPLSIALHAVNRTEIRINDTVLVIGAGPIGLMLLKILKISNSGLIIMADIDEGRLEAAHKAGADVVINTGAETGLKQLREKIPNGADVVFEAVGFGPAVNNALAMVRRGGAVTLVGNAAPHADIDFQKIVLNEVRVNGSYACANEYEGALVLLSNGSVKIDDIISVTAPFEEGQQWFDRLKAHEAGLIKVVLTM
jgi:threonine dehydrogenase-like Zn-dependent dehydrogenase